MLTAEERSLRTYRGNLRVLLIVCALTYSMWNSHDFLAWCRWVFDVPYEIDLAKQRWARLWAVILGGIGIGNNLIMMILIALNRRRTRRLKQEAERITDLVRKADLDRQIQCLKASWG